MKMEVGGQREERKIEAHPVSCLLWRPLPYSNHQSANNNSRATILFILKKPLQPKNAAPLLLQESLCT